MNQCFPNLKPLHSNQLEKRKYVYSLAKSFSVIACTVICFSNSGHAKAQAQESSSELRGPLKLQDGVEKNSLSTPLTLYAAVTYADRNYPSIRKNRALEQAARKNVSVQKLNEYLPDSLFQYQEIMSSHNKISQVFFGSPVFPAMAGPGERGIDMSPIFYSGAGFSLDWAPLDFGLHKARINLSKTQSEQASAQFELSRFDVSVAVASAFLDLVEALEQVKAAELNLASFSQFRTIVDAQVNASLKPGADASLAEAQLANARNQVIRANLSRDLAIANLANAIGEGGKDLSINPAGFASDAPNNKFQQAAPLLDEVPILRSAKVAVKSAKAQRRILDKEYYPVFHFLGGVQTRGSGLALNGRERQSLGADGVFPVIPNYQAALVINWNFLDYYRLREQKRVQDQRIIAQEEDYKLILQNLKAENARAQARVKTAIQLAENMPVQVNAASLAVKQAEARYKTGLGSVAQVAEANTVLAQSRMQDALARVGIWRALLSVAAAHGDLKPFLAEAQRIQSKGI
ncbi:MAG: TolC family protein [Candidatus Obscuribacterales bacterium]|nr:TolC family protein [Candidatus Obscuribacterales bacterium]